MEMENEQIKAGFMMSLERQNLSEGRKQRYWALFEELETLGIDLDNITTESIDKYFFYLRNTRHKDWTKVTLWAMFKRVCRFVDKTIDFSEYKFKKPKGNENIEVLTAEQVYSMFKTARTFRNKLIVLLLFETGMRIGELVSLRRQDVRFDDNGAVLRVNGKTGVRPIRVVKIASFLKSYVELMREEKLFDVTRRDIEIMISNTAKRSGIKQRVYPHLLRHTRCTLMAQYLTEPEMRIYFGWSSSSNMPSTYVHLSARDVEKKIIQVAEMEKDVLNVPI